jgi:hypothetical protein
MKEAVTGVTGKRIFIYENVWNLDIEPLPSPGPVQKKSFLGSGPGVISYRLSDKRVRSANSLKSSSGIDGQTDGQTKCGQ